MIATLKVIITFYSNVISLYHCKLSTFDQNEPKKATSICMNITTVVQTEENQGNNLFGTVSQNAMRDGKAENTQMQI